MSIRVSKPFDFLRVKMFCFSFAVERCFRFFQTDFFLAVGLQNGQICLFDVLGNGDFRLRLEEKSNLNEENRPVIDVIWSSDSKWLLVVFDENRYELCELKQCEK